MEGENNMPYKSDKQRRFMHARHPEIAAKWDAEMRKKKKKVPIVINNKMKGDYGATSFDKKNKPTKVEINIKRHKGDEAELASTVKHELMHVKFPNMTEKEVYKRTRKTKIPEAEQHKLLAKIKRKSVNYKMGAIKRKFKSGRDNQPPGTFIKKANDMKREQKVAFMGAA